MSSLKKCLLVPIFLLLSSVYYFYILEIKALSIMLFANIFSLFVVVFLFMVS